MIWGAYFSDGRRAESAARGYDFCWVIANTLDGADLDAIAATHLKIVLLLHWTEATLFQAEAFREWVVFLRPHFEARGLLDRVIAVQFDDEFDARAATNRQWFIDNGPGNWPVWSEEDPCEHRLTGIARASAKRKADFLQVWGQMPLYGFGAAINASVTPVLFHGQDWIGCNFYVTPDQPPSKVHRLYAQAATAGIRLMPMLGIYSDAGLPLQSLPTMGAAYLPPLTTHRALMPFGGIFCYSFPGHATNGARGVRELPVEYQHGEAWILNQYGDSRAAATMVNPFA